MLNLAKMSEWLRGLFIDETYGFSRDLYNDIVPSGVHRTNRSDY